MNLFGPALEKALKDHNIGKLEFAESCGLHRNQLTNIMSGDAQKPHKIEQIFAALRALIPLKSVIDLGILFLEDRRADIGFSSSDIIIRRSDNSGANGPRRRLLDVYDREEDIRSAIDQIVAVITDIKKPKIKPKNQNPA